MGAYGGEVSSGSFGKIGFFYLGQHLEVAVARRNITLQFSSRQALNQGDQDHSLPTINIKELIWMAEIPYNDLIDPGYDCLVQGSF